MLTELISDIIAEGSRFGDDDEDETLSNDNEDLQTQSSYQINLAKINDVIINQSSYIRMAKKICNLNLFGSSYFTDQLGPIFNVNDPIWISIKKIKRIAQLDENKDQTDELLEIFQEWVPSTTPSQPNTQSQVGQSQTTGQPQAAPTTPSQPPTQSQANQSQTTGQPQAAPNAKVREFLNLIHDFPTTKNGEKLINEFKGTTYDDVKDKYADVNYAIAQINTTLAAVNNDPSNIDACLQLIREIRGLSAVLHRHEKIPRDIPDNMNAKIKAIWSDCDAELLLWEYDLLEEKSKQVTSAFI